MIQGMAIPPAPWTLHMLSSAAGLGWLTDAKGALLIPHLEGDPALLRLLEVAPELLKLLEQPHPGYNALVEREAWVRYVREGGPKPTLEPW